MAEIKVPTPTSDQRRLASQMVGTQNIDGVAKLIATIEEGGKPIPLRLSCESCGTLHVDEGEFANKPHHTHSCQACGLTWRPSVVCTVGVRFLPGYKNEPV